MKHLKKITSILMVFVMAFAMSITAFAAQDAETTGTITINNAKAGQTYTIYRILDLESYNSESGAYAYTANEAWKTFINSDEAKKYVSVDSQGYVTWVENADAAAFAKAALAYAKENNISAIDTKTAGEGATVVSGLELGYYLVDSTLGALCGLNTTNPNATIQEKNTEPTTDKQVQENSTGNWGDANDANIGDTVNFKATIEAKKGAENYVFHDKMSAGLTFNADSVDIAGLTAGTDYTVVTADLGDDCTFEIKFAQAYLDTIDKDTTLTITYTAALNVNAVVAGNGNLNEEKLTYGDNNETAWSQTTTYTWTFDVEKLTTKDGKEINLAGAVFKLSTDKEGNNIVKFNKVRDNLYQHNASGNVETFTTDETGKFTLEGLDSGTYYLTETEAPAGYNKLAGPVTVVIDDKGNIKFGEVTLVEAADKNVKVENSTGSILPETGGMGTTIFYVLGAILTLGAAVVLIVRRRMRVQ